MFNDMEGFYECTCINVACGKHVSRAQTQQSHRASQRADSYLELTILQTAT
ncbi:MAG: hypothetical protein RLY32_296 [Pseudomonadota bacterium]